MTRLIFNREQRNVIKAAGLEVAESADYNEDDIIAIDEKIKEYLLYAGFDKEYNFTAEGRIAKQLIRYLYEKQAS